MLRFYMISKLPQNVHQILSGRPHIYSLTVDLLIIFCAIVCACKSERSGCQMVRLF